MIFRKANSDSSNEGVLDKHTQPKPIKEMSAFDFEAPNPVAAAANDFFQFGDVPENKPAVSASG